ncbi:unnamed protein product [Anisakis simplex]|uniref:Uncharacterized protein n=1 Tax=Anisakis simplex TaxID=6269 RepID=A0A0M3K394_ANISI|nr:unnamed protein product [Anisakis simplex]
MSLNERYMGRYCKVSIIFEGFLMCKGASKSSWCLPKSSHKWETYWCAIYPGFIYLWPGHKPKTLTNRIALKLNQSMSVQVSPFVYSFIFELFSSVLSDMKLAIQYQTKEDLKRYDQKCSKKSEKLIATEKNLTWRLALESENARLMQLLDDERRALHDEETVRALATRFVVSMLDEERDRREQLEERVRVLENMVNEQSSQRRETISSMDKYRSDCFPVEFIKT